MVLADPVSILAEDLLLDRVAASIVASMATGPEIVKLGTGRTSAIAAGTVATLKEIARIAQRN